MTSTPPPLLGWREWAMLPDLGINQIKVKVDTGARSSALHTLELEPYVKDNENWLMFRLDPSHKQNGAVIECHAPIKDKRVVANSGGHKQRRYVIETKIIFGHYLIQAEITLTKRDTMRFPMLLGRTAMNKRFHIDPHASYLQGKPSSVNMIDLRQLRL